MSSENGQDPDLDTLGLYRALGHPGRARALELMCEGPTSPSELAREMGVPVGNVAYHVRVLRDGDWIVPAGTRPVRGALEHFYEASGKVRSCLLTLDEHAWQQLVARVDAFYVEVRKLQADAARRARRRKTSEDDAPARFGVSVMTLVHSAQLRTQSSADPGRRPTRGR